MKKFNSKLVKFVNFQTTLAITILISLIGTKVAHAIEHYGALTDYQTLKSGIITVNYDPEDHEFARLSLEIAKQSLEYLSHEFDWTPKSDIQILIADQTDLTNGYATPIPFNRIVLFTSPPSGFNELNDNGSWLERLILHEMVHIVHIDKADGFPELARNLFGRNPLLFPNALQPTFLKEGLATFYESSNTSGSGRAQSAYYEMIQRVEVATGFLPLSKVQQVTKDWPRNKAYSYGVAFFQFIHERYGKEAVTQFIESYSDNIIPFLLDGSVSSATSAQSIEDLWLEFEEWMFERYQAQIEFLGQSQNTSSKTLIADAPSTSNRILIGQEGHTYFIKTSAFRPYYLSRIGLDNQVETLTAVSPSARMVGAREPHVWFVQESHCDLRRSSFDLFVYNIELESTERLTDCKHFVEGDIFVDEKEAVKLAAITHNRGRKALVIYDLATKSSKELTEVGFLSNMASPVWSDDGKTITFTSRETSGSWDLRQISINNAGEVQNESKLLQQPGNNFFHLSKGSHNKEFFLTSDINNQLEIWRFNQDTQSLEQVTQGLGGSIWPTYDDRTDKIRYLNYQANGWQIAYTTESLATPEDSDLLSSAPQLNQVFSPNVTFDLINIPDFEQSPYSAFNTVYPTTWFLSYENDEYYNALRVQTFGRDALNFHNWFLDVGRDTENELNLGLISYTYLNHFNLSYERYYDYTESSDELVITEENTEYSLTAFYGTKLFNYRVMPYLGTNLSRETQFDFRLDLDRFEKEVITHGIGMIADSSGRALLSLGPSWGRRITATFERDSVEAFAANNFFRVDAETDGNVWTLDWREYISPYQDHRFEFRWYIANADRGADLFDLSGSSLRSNFTNNLLHKRDLELRGYPDSSFELVGLKPRIYSFDYEFPLFTWDEGLSGWPIGLHRLSGNLFYESGEADDQYERYDSAGFEANLGIDLGYSLLPVRLTFGVAQPLQDISSNREKDPDYYLNVFLGL